MKHYELNYLALPNLSQEELQELQTLIENNIQENNGSIVGTKKTIKRSLPHRIKSKESGRLDTANLSSLTFTAETDKIKAIELKLKEDKRILRYFILNKSENSHKLSSLARSGKQIKKQEKVSLEKLDEKLDEILENV